MIKKIVFSLCAFVLLSGIFFPFAYASDAAAGNPNFYTALEDVVTTDWNIEKIGKDGSKGVKAFLQNIASGELGAGGISDFIVNIFTKILIPVFALAGIVLAIIGFFKLMSSTDEKELSKGWNFLLRGVIGTLIMVSAAWIVIQFVGADGTGGIINGGENATGAQLASDLYGKIFYPLIKVIMNIILGILFIMAVSQGFKYLFKGDDTEAQKRILAIFVYTVIGILVIVLAKTLVEAVYGPYKEVINITVKPGGEDLGKIGDGVFNKPKMETLRLVINRLLGIATFIITTIIIYIGYLLLAQPTSEETATKLKKAIMRVIAGILLIGVAYLVANFVIIK